MYLEEVHYNFDRTVILRGRVKPRYQHMHILYTVLNVFPVVLKMRIY